MFYLQEVEAGRAICTARTVTRYVPLRYHSALSKLHINKGTVDNQDANCCSSFKVWLSNLADRLDSGKVHIKIHGHLLVFHMTS